TASALIYSTYLGGSVDDSPGAGGEDTANGITLDSSGDAIIIGDTISTDFPLTAGALFTQNNTWLESGDGGSFVTKINNTGTALLYSTYLVGSGDFSSYTCDCAHAVATDPSGNVYVTGVTVSTDFPTTSGAFQRFPPTGSGAYE